VTVKVFPAIVIVPVLEELPEFKATEKFAVPFPEPLLPEVIVIQASLLTAVQLHPFKDVTPTLPVPPAAPKDWLVGEIE
jgi:hypothetical protein